MFRIITSIDERSLSGMLTPVRLTSPAGMGHGHLGSSGELSGFQNGQTSFYFALASPRRIPR